MSLISGRELVAMLSAWQHRDRTSLPLDQSAAMLSVAQQAAVQAGVQIQFRQHSLDMDLPSEPSSFDLVLAPLVLCHVENLAHVAHEAYRVLCPGGHIVVTDFHPAVIAAGWRTQFTHTDGTYLLPTAQHTRDHYFNLGEFVPGGACRFRLHKGQESGIPIRSGHQASLLV